MKGVIRTKELCPKCGGRFSLEFTQIDIELTCPGCLTRPKRVYIDARSLGIGKVYSDRDGTMITSARQAFRILERIRGEVDSGSFVRGNYIKRNTGSVMVARLLDEWEQAYKGAKPETRRGKNRIIRAYIRPRWGDTDIRDITKRQAAAWINEMPLKPMTVAIRTQFQAFLNWAHETLDDLSIPRIKLPTIRLPQKPIKWLTADQQDQIRAHLSLQFHPIIRFIETYGCRQSEARALQWDCVDFERTMTDDEGSVVCRGEVVIKRNYSANQIVTPKEGKEKALPMTPEIREMLLFLKSDRINRPNPLDPHVFVNRLGKHYTHDITTAYKRAAKKAGYPGATLHMHRHSFVMQRLGEYSYEEIGAVLGHESIATTMKYGRLESRKLVRVIGMRAWKQNQQKESIVPRPSP